VNLFVSCRWRTLVWLLLLLVLIIPQQTRAQGPTVQALLFYSETCPHCHEVMEHTLPPLKEKYGPRLQIKELEIGDPKNFELMLKLEAAYQIPEQLVGVPEMFIGSDYLIGSIEIPQKLPGLIEKYLAQGGVKFPTVEPSPAATASPVATGSAAIASAPPTVQSPAAVAFYVFWDDKCDSCVKLMNQVLPDILSRYPKGQIKVEDYNIERTGYNLMRDLETHFGLEIGGMPEVFIGDQALLGLEEIQSRLPLLIDQYLAAGGIGLPGLEGEASAAVAPSEVAKADDPARVEPIHLAYFYQVGCRECDRAELDLKFLEQKYPQLQVESFDSREKAALLELLGARAGVPESRRLLAPAVFVGDDALVLEQVSAKNLESLVKKYLGGGAPAVWADEATLSEQATKGILERFRSFGALTVAGAGIIDGLNPCAFATIVFFISYLTLVGRQGREILAVGLAFTVGVFLTYLGVGFGFLKAVAALPVLTLLGPWVYGLTALLCFVLAGFSLHDFAQARRGKPEEMRLKLPTSLRRHINRIIREGVGLRAFVPVAFGTGIVISLIELACTGQIYLPVIMFVLSVPEMRPQAVSYLLLYNLMFIVPLVVVFLAAYWGASSERMGILVSRHAPAVKLATTVLFVVMGVWLLFTLLG